MANWTTNLNAPYVQDQKATSGMDWGGFYGSLGPTNVSPNGVSAGAPQASFNAGMTGRGLPANYQTQMNNWAVDNALRSSVPTLAAFDANGKPIYPIGSAPVNPPVGVPKVPVPGPIPATWNTLDQAAYDARNKPGTWMAQSRMQAQALMRQMALRNAAPAMMPQSVPAKVPAGGIASLLTGKGTPRAAADNGGLFGLLFGGGAPAPARTGPSGVGTNGYTYVNGQNMGYSPDVLAARAAQGQAIGNANRHNPNPTYSASGENNAFMPTSYQNSVRQQTGY